MRPISLLAYLLYICTVGVAVEAIPTKNNTQARASLKIAQWEKHYHHFVEATVKARHSGCTSDNIVYRQEWGALSKQSRIDYIDAVRCLQQKSPISSKSDVPGARSRFDDFVATHIIQAQQVHFSGLFLHFHRYFVWLYEKALQEECGYRGTQPYWDWTLSWQDPRKSSVFDGSPTSLGGNGEAVPHGIVNVTAFGITIPVSPGTGGGCVTSGPFSNVSVNLGPVSFAPIDSGGGLDYNPRCLRRDISLSWSKQTKPSDITKLISSCADLGCFDDALEALNGTHTGGHYIFGGDPGLDPFASPGDPVFWLHHAQVDRVWTLWQSLNPGNRTRQVYGTNTPFNIPPSPKVTLNTSIEFGILAPRQPLSRLVSAIDGPFCYVYI